MKRLNATALIAPCGMNCGICMAYLREKDHCPGCRAEPAFKPASCVRCRILNCDLIRTGRARFCLERDDKPCQRLKDLDKRYRTKYNMSMLENLAAIRRSGIRKFAAEEKRRWTCRKCGGTINVHRAVCSECGEGAEKPSSTRSTQTQRQRRRSFG
ncbi:DUF3795 domain-containing protein [bacterium]|nr:DUF3795 domain-containing protein [bacterium]